MGLGGSSMNNEISNNIIYNSIEMGIFVDSSDNNSILSNAIYSNIDYGIKLDTGSENNRIYYNDFADNQLTPGYPQASDDGSNNVFKENDLNDWNGSGTYPIYGSVDNEDSSPCVNPYFLQKSSITPSITGIMIVFPILVILIFRKVKRGLI